MSALSKLACGHVVKGQVVEGYYEDNSQWCKYDGWQPVEVQWIYMWHVNCPRCQFHVQGRKGGRKRYQQIVAKHLHITGHRASLRWYANAPSEVLKAMRAQEAAEKYEQRRLDLPPPF